LDDADFEQATAIALRSTFFNCGQNCIAAERFYVQRSIYPQFVKFMREKVSNFRQGNALEGHVDIGSMCMPRQVEIVDELVQDAVKKGAKVECGARKNPNLKEGLFYEPTVLSDVSHEMRIIKEETFGPVMLIIPFEKDEDVIRLSNDTEFGLGSSIFSKNYERAERIAKAHVSGMCAFNEWGISSIINSLPFGGCKVSGKKKKMQK
jgi:acyl-CoA reductase-like NAD-dependent aldehyde dehydrogenase